MNDAEFYKLYKKQKAAIISRLKRKVSPYLYPCGYVDEKEHDERLRIFPISAIDPRRGDQDEANIKCGQKIFDKDLREEGIHGFTRTGIMLHGYGGGRVTAEYEGFCLEDLWRMERRVNKWFEDRKDKLKAYMKKRKENKDK